MYDYSGYDYGTDYGSTLGGVLGGLAIFILILLLIVSAICIVQLIAQWKLYKKAGKGGWEAIVPFYCNWVLVEIAGLKWYWFLFFFAPMIFSYIGLDAIGWLAYYFAMFNIFYNLSKKFNKGTGFAICGTLFTPICIMILGFSKKEVYNKNAAVSEHGVFGKANNNTQNTPQQPVYTQQPVNPTPVMPAQQPAMPQETVQQSVNNQTEVPSFCTNCGNALMPGAKFCTKCGKQM